jgi:diguanylate cyclase (GGDEF)-like protein
MIYNGELSGILDIRSKDMNAYTDYIAEITLNFAAQASIALENAKLFSKIKKSSITDSLTGLYNRRYFFEFASKCMEMSENEGIPTSLILLDVDYFKNCNDIYGHQFGDEVLKIVAEICLNSVRATDIVARYGGEEFIIILPDVNLVNCRVIAEKIRKNIENTKFTCGEKNDIKITVSMGAASTEKEATSLQKLIEVADRALYKAKNSGRNKIE